MWSSPSDSGVVAPAPRVPAVWLWALSIPQPNPLPARLPSDAMHLRRALLLFALVLGLAALVAPLASHSPERRSKRGHPQPSDTGPQAEPRAPSGRDLRVEVGRG